MSVVGVIRDAVVRLSLIREAVALGDDAFAAELARDLEADLALTLEPLEEVGRT